MSLKNFSLEASNGMPSPVYLISSQDDFLLYESLTLIKEKLSCADSINFAQYDLDSSESPVSIKEIVTILNTPPFFGERRIIILKNLQKLPKKEIKRFAEYLISPAQYTLLVMLFKGDHKKFFDAAILNKTKLIPININATDIPLWIKEKAKKSGIQLTENAVEYIVNTVGDDLAMLNSEIQKISLIGKKTVDISDIKEVLCEGIEFDAFQLARALERKDKKSVFKIYYNIEKNIDPYKLLGALNWHYRALYDKTKEEQRVEYYKIFRLLFETDFAIKNSQSNAMENFLIKMLRVEQKARE